MRVLDFLMLAQDYAKNTPVRIRVAGKDLLVDTFRQQVVNEQPQLIVVSKRSGRPLKLWELRVLLDKPELRQSFMYVQEPDDLRPLLGFQNVKGTIAIN